MAYKMHSESVVTIVGCVMFCFGLVRRQGGGIRFTLLRRRMVKYGLSNVLGMLNLPPRPAFKIIEFVGLVQQNYQQLISTRF